VTNQFPYVAQIAAILNYVLTVNDTSKRGGIISTLACLSNLPRSSYEEAICAAVLNVALDVAQSRFAGTWEMKMDTLQFSSPPEDYLFADGMYP
jgi:hypothetical protein